MNVFYTPDIEKLNELPEEEAGHCLRVLRLRAGDEMMLTDGKGYFYKAVIRVATAKRCTFEILETLHQPPMWKGRIHLALAPTKNMDRIEWLVEKATEIGVDEISFLQCRFSERKILKTERIERIVVSAMKQSLKARMPIIHEMMDIRAFLRQADASQKFIAHCYDEEKVFLKDTLKPVSDTIVMIGPEGDFSTEEVTEALNLGYLPVSLGLSRLRTETAALVAVHTFNLINS